MNTIEYGTDVSVPTMEKHKDDDIEVALATKPIIEKVKEIQKKLIGLGTTLSTAESCTGGRIAAAFTANAGSSQFFEGGIVAYQNRVKENVLGVSDSTIKEHDVVSKEVAEEMVRGAVKLFGTDIAVASTGYAGPDGGTDDIPTGTIWLSCGGSEHQLSYCFHGDTDREANVCRAVLFAMLLVNKYIEKYME